MTAWVHLLEDSRHLARGIDHECRARDPHPLGAERVLLHPHAVLLRDGVVFIDEQGHRKPILRLELVVRLGAVAAHAEDFRIESLEPRECVSERARLDGSARGVVLRIEEQHHPFPFVVRQGNTFARIIGRAELRCFVSSFGTGHSYKLADAAAHNRPYSARNASVGCTRSARMVGTMHASAQTASIRIEYPTNST